MVDGEYDGWGGMGGKGVDLEGADCNVWWSSAMNNV